MFMKNSKQYNDWGAITALYMHMETRHMKMGDGAPWTYCPWCKAFSKFRLFCASLKNHQEEISNLPSSPPSMTMLKMNHICPELQKSVVIEVAEFLPWGPCCDWLSPGIRAKAALPALIIAEGVAKASDGLLKGKLLALKDSNQKKEGQIKS